MYKDKDKRREAQRERTRRYRAKQKGVTSECVTQGVTSIVQHVAENGGEISYKTVKDTIQDVHITPKRGTDIKTFKDLPLDVQRDIETMSSHAGQRGESKAEDKAKRTARAICYQHIFPNRYETTGLCPQTTQLSPGAAN